MKTLENAQSEAWQNYLDYKKRRDAHGRCQLHPDFWEVDCPVCAHPDRDIRAEFEMKQVNAGIPADYLKIRLKHLTPDELTSVNKFLHGKSCTPYSLTIFGSSAPGIAAAVISRLLWEKYDAQYIDSMTVAMRYAADEQAYGNAQCRHYSTHYRLQNITWLAITHLDMSVSARMRRIIGKIIQRRMMYKLKTIVTTTLPWRALAYEYTGIAAEWLQSGEVIGDPGQEQEPDGIWWKEE